MNIAEFVSQLLSQDILLWVEAGRLRISTQKGAFTPELRRALSEHKAEIIAFLQKGGEVQTADAQRILPVSREQSLPLSFPQLRLWFLDQFLPESPAYSVPMVMMISGELESGSLEKALNEIVRRHEILRTVFALDENDNPVQRIFPYAWFDLPLISLEKIEEHRWQAEMLSCSQELARIAFDLSQGPLYRFCLIRHSRQKHALYFNFHHTVYDGWSSGIFIGELTTLYEAFSSGHLSPLPELAVQYADYAAWQQRTQASGAFDNQLAYWKEKLSGPLPVLTLRSDRPRPSLQTFSGALRKVVFPLPLTGRLKALASTQGATLFMVLLAAFDCLLYRYSCQQDLIVGTPVANRHDSDVEKLIGSFINMLALRVDLSGNPTFLELLQQVRQVALEAFEHQELPFETLVEALHLPRHTSHPPVFQVMFALQKAPSRSTVFPGCEIDLVYLDTGASKFDLSLNIYESPEGLGCMLEYNTDLYEPATMDRMLAHYQSVLESICASPEKRVFDLPWTAAKEKHQDQNELRIPPPCTGQEVEIKEQSTPQFLALLRQRDIRLWLEGERLRASVPAGKMTSEIQMEITRRKQEITAFLRAAAAHQAELPLVPVPRTGPLPLSFAQQRLWFLDQLEPNSHAYNIVSALRLSGELDVSAMQASLDEIIRRHEAVRTTFHFRDGQPVQVIEPPAPFPLQRIDLRYLPPEEREAEAQRFLYNLARQPFDLERDILLRGALLTIDESSFIMIAATHHIVSDGWSMNVFTREFNSLYRAFIQGKPSPLSPLPLQYADFAVWQRQRLQGARLEDELAYWQERLAPPLPVLDLPADHPRPAAQTFNGERILYHLPLDFWETVRTFSAHSGATLFMTLLAVFDVLLYRYTRQEDLLVGTPVAERSQEETENLIGFFVNNLVLRADLSGNPTFSELLDRIRQVTLDAFSHQELPFQILVDTLHPERDLSRMPFFQVMFSLQNVPIEEGKLPGLEHEPIIFNAGVARFDLTLEIWELTGKVWLFTEYNTDLFERATIDRMMDHFQNLLRAAVANPQTRINDLPLMNVQEAQLLLEEWNQTSQDIPSGVLSSWFEKQVRLSPDAAAVHCAGQSLTYAGLNARANQLAHYLRTLGAGPDVLIAVFMERSVDMLVSLLAVQKSGSAYVPLDPIYPRERLAYMLEDCRAPLLLTQTGLSDFLPQFDGQLVCIDSSWPEIASHSCQDLPACAAPDHLAYVIYTSGSTGRPKGVQVLQRGLVNFLASMQREPGFCAQDILLAVTTLSFDIAGLELYLPLVSGGQVVIASSEQAMDGQRLAAALVESGATVMQATPASWRMLIAAGWVGQPGLKILCGGEALDADLASQLLPRCASLWNLYGPTETTIWSTIHPVRSVQGTLPIGRPVANTCIYIVDPQLQPVPVGIPGELLIGGDGVARGYLNRPELTAEKFIPNPFLPNSGNCLYRTGDLARYLPDGNIEFLGRIDHQVKIRGFRIELGEIEAELMKLSGVHQAVVIAREDQPGDRRLVAYLQANPPAVPAQSEIRLALKHNLPEYMLPSAFVFLDEFPLTPSGKIDRRSLPAPEGERPDLGANFVAPRNATEQRLAGIWQDLLKLNQVGVDDNFFELGGHSLLIVQAHSRIRQAFDTTLTVAQMFQYPTISSLAQFLDKPGVSKLSVDRIRQRAEKQRQAAAQQAVTEAQGESQYD